MLILFIGFNPSLRSHELGYNYAGRSNRFYTILYQADLTDQRFQPEDSPQLLPLYRYGFTNIVARPTKSADELTSADYDEGRLILREKLQRYRPRIACYVGKGVYEQFVKRRGGIAWGVQAESQVAGVVDFVAPSTSGLVRLKLSEQVAVYRQLRDLALTMTHR